MTTMLRAGNNPVRVSRLPGAAWCTVALLASLLAFASPAAAHGVFLTSGQGQATWVRGEYSDEEVMSFAKVKIFGPDGKTRQVGNADADGRFAWLPKEPGVWKATFDDGMGHLAELNVDVAAKSTGAQSSTSSTTEPADMGQSQRPRPKVYGIVLGLSIIFWASGLLFWRWARRAQKECAATEALHS
jgi:nickel transport protein